MESKTLLTELERKIQRFCEVRDWDQFHGPKELAIGLVTEASELLEQFRFLSDEQAAELLADPNRKIKVENELADVLFFLLRFAQMNDIDVESAFRRKMEINEKNYPVEKAKGRNLKYRDL
jgi:NTP pyrophosphatase (non-canonical NTP hydrolase)